MGRATGSGAAAAKLASLRACAAASTPPSPPAAPAFRPLERAGADAVVAGAAGTAAGAGAATDAAGFCGAASDAGCCGATAGAGAAAPAFAAAGVAAAAGAATGGAAVAAAGFDAADVAAAAAVAAVAAAAASRAGWAAEPRVAGLAGTLVSSFFAAAVSARPRLLGGGCGLFGEAVALRSAAEERPRFPRPSSGASSLAASREERFAGCSAGGSAAVVPLGMERERTRTQPIWTCAKNFRSCGWDFGFV